jgi:hypothetical protein
VSICDIPFVQPQISEAEMPLPDFFQEASSSKGSQANKDKPIYPLHLLQDKPDDTEERIESGKPVLKIPVKVCFQLVIELACNNKGNKIGMRDMR